MDRTPLREHNIIDDDLEDGFVGPERRSNLSWYLHSAAVHAKIALFKVSCTLLPSFVSSRLRASIPSGSSNHSRYTSALDGVRGCACIAVMNYHILWVYQPFVHYGYGLSQEDLAVCIQEPNVVMRNDSLLQLPIVRLLYSPTGSVSAFFVIAGFVLAYKPLTLSRKGRWLDVFSSLTSSTFRRAIRLYLPAIAASLLSLITFRFGWWQYRDVLVSSPLSNQISTTEVSEPVIISQPTLLLQVGDWLQDLSNMINNWSWPEYYPKYNAHLWTIGSELRASMVVFLTLPVYLMMRTPYRVILILLLIFYAYAYHRWDVTLFLSGIMLADLSQARQMSFEDERDPSHQPIFLGGAPRPTWRIILHNLLQVLLLILALYTLSTPDFCLAYTPGYRHLSRFIPPPVPETHRFYPSLGALLTVFLVSYNPPSWFLNHYILNSSVAQYFGRISLSLYLLHGPLLHIVGYRLFAWAWSCTGREGLLAYCAGFGLAYCIFFALVVWVSDIFWRVVDVRSVHFARWLERRVMSSTAESVVV